MVKGGQFKILTRDQIEDIHLATLDIIQNVGVMIEEPNALQILKDAGADIVDGNIARLPPYLVEETIKRVPSGFTVHARNSKHDVRMEDRKVFFEPIIGRINVLDIETGVRRPTTLKDTADLVRLADYLENFDILHSGAMMPQIEGLPAGVSHVHGYFAGVTNSEKVVKGTGRGTDKAADCIRMAAVMAGGEEEMRRRPNIFTTCNVVSPLQLPRVQTEGIIEYAKYGLPVDIAAEPQAGATAPVTLAGLLVQENATILTAMTVAQLVHPGTPVWYGTVGAVMDMHQGTIALGSAEAALINAAVAQIAQYYHIPSRGSGGLTESKVLDAQAGYEKMMTLMLPALAGINMIFYPGVLDLAVTISYEGLVIDNEICGMVRRVLRAIDITEETLATSVIKKVGPGGSFLGQRHTVDYLMKEHYIPQLSNREMREGWEAAGSKDTWTVAREKAKQILRDHHPTPLDKDVEAELKKIIKKVDRRVLEKN